jgi:hypothetical protein
VFICVLILCEAVFNALSFQTSTVALVRTFESSLI